MAVAALALTGAGQLAGAADSPLLLDVVVNGYPTNKIGEFVMRNGILMARRSELIDLGFGVPDSAAEDADGLIAVKSLPSIAVRVDQATQTVHVEAKGDSLLPALLQAGVPTGMNTPVESGTGLTLGYDVLGTATGGQNVLSGLFDFRAFSPWGVVSSSALAYAGATASGPGGYTAIRLDSTYVYSDVDSLRRYRLGDFINGGLSWTRPVRLGGGQITRDFSMRPDLITFPLPTVSGSAAVPSTVDVMVNGAQLLSRQVQPGPFQIPQLPVITGAGTVAMTVSDALGRQVTTTVPFYASSSLLAPGLQAYSAEFGAVRRHWGTVSNDYGNLAGSGTYRLGLSSDLTIEAHAEGTSGQFMAGAGVVSNVFNLGVVSVSGAGSTGPGGTGSQISVSAQRIGTVLSLGASATLSSRGFRDIAAMNGDPAPRQQITANAGLSLGRYGSVGVAYVGINRDTSPAPINVFAPFGNYANQNTTLVGGTAITSGNVVSFIPAQRVSIVSASYSLPIGDVSVYATGFRDFARGGGSGVLFGLTIPLGVRSSISANAGSSSGSRYGQLQATQSAVSIGDWGYQLYGGAGDPARELGLVQYKSPWALVSAGVDRTNHQTAVRAEVQGAVSLAGGGLFASNPINDSFAVVDTNGAAGIRVLEENREVGRTDSAGRLLLTDLRSFDINHISIDPTDVPADATLAYTTREVRPQDRAGVVVRFPVRTSHGALVRLIDTAGKPIPVGSTVRLGATGVTVPVGYDGEAYMQDLEPHNAIAVERPDGRRCRASFDYGAVAGQIPAIGPVPCRDAP